MATNPWKPIEKPKPAGPCLLHIHNEKQGTLNGAARDFLNSERVRWERHARTGTYSLVATREGGIQISKRGQIYMTPLRDVLRETLPPGETLMVTLTQDATFGRRLVFAGTERLTKERSDG